MADKHLTENLKGNYFSSERKDMTFLKGITLVALLHIEAWIIGIIFGLFLLQTFLGIILYKHFEKHF